MEPRNRIGKQIASAAAIALACVLFAPNTASAAGWRSVRHLPTTLFGAAAATGHNGKVYVFGGGCPQSATCPFGISSATLQYNPATNHWVSRAPMPAPRYYATAVTGSGGMILVAGGYDQTNAAVSTAWQYNPRTDTWKTVASMGAPRAVATAALGSDNRIYVFGGDEGDGPGDYFIPTNTVEAYDPFANTWAPATSMSRIGYAAAAVAVGSTIYFCGGYVGGLGRNSITSEVDAYSVSSNTWSIVAPMPRAEDLAGAALAGDGKVYVVGGLQFVRRHVYQAQRLVSVYDPSADTWSTGPLLPQRVKDHAVASVPGGSLYSIGGDSQSGPLDSVYALP